MTLTTSPQTELEEHPAYRIELSAVSNDFVSAFFEVRDSAVSWIDARTLESLRYEKHTVEGRRIRDERIDFDPAAGTARRGKKTIPFTRPAYDSLSALYLVRTRPLKEGEPLDLEVVAGHHAYVLTVEVLDREAVKTPAGVFQTRRVHPKMKEDAPLKSQGDLWLWLTEDERKIPVMIRSKLKFGSLTARLVGQSASAENEASGR
jgi:hypothetical protein